MEKLDPEINIGEIIAGRVKGYPVLEEEPKPKRARKKSKSKIKRQPKKGPPCWIICPSFIVKPPKVVSKEAGEKSYNFTVMIFSETRKERDEVLEHMIRCGQKEIEAGDKRFWLHAVTRSIVCRALFEAKLKYIFRVKQISEKIS